MSSNGNNQQGGLAQALALFGLLIAISVAVILFSPSSNPAVSSTTPADQATVAPVVMGEATPDHQHGGDADKPADGHGDHQHGEDADKPADGHGDHQHGEDADKPADGHGDHQNGEDADKSSDDHADHQQGETFVRFVNLEDGQTVTSPFVVEMAVSDNLEVVPAGGEVHDHSGHLHILVNTDFVQEGEMIEDDHQHLHFSEGEISTELTLEAGEYVLRLQFANSDHIAYAGEAYTDEVTITVSN